MSCIAETFTITNNSFITDPQTYSEAMSSVDNLRWRNATLEEWNALLFNNTFEMFTDTDNKTPIQIPPDIRPIGSRWVYKIKLNPDGTRRFKVRLVVKGYLQTYGINYTETFALVSKLSTFRVLLALSTKNNWRIYHLDVVTAFLNPKIDQDNIYMELPEGMEWIDNRVPPKAKVRLLKSLYGLKQSPRLWYQTINTFLLSLGLKQSSADSNLYITKDVLVLLYVDDTPVFDTSDPNSKESGIAATRIMTVLKSEYRMTDLGPIQRFLGFDIRQTETGLTMDQEIYIDMMVQKYNLQNSKSCYSPLDPNVRLENGECEDHLADKKIYQSMIGSLIYASLGTRPDITFAVAALSKYNASPLTTHMTAAIRVIRYLKTTSKMKLHFPQEQKQVKESILEGFTDSDWAGCKTTRKSIGGHIFLVNGTPVSWQAKGQTVVALSTLEAELIACSDGSREAIWLKRLLTDLGAINSSQIIPINCDN